MLPRRTTWAVAIVATLTMTVSYFDRTTFAVLAPEVTKALGISNTAYGWLTSAFSFAYLVATPLAGRWIDRVGARRGLVGSVLLWTTVAALHAAVPGFWVLFMLRIALGVAEGPSFPGSAQTVHRVLSPTDRGRGFGVLFTGSSIGGMLAPIVAAALFSIGGWRFAFAGSALVGLVWIPLWLAVTRRADVRAQLDNPNEPDLPAPTTQLTLGALLLDRNLLRGFAAIFAVAPIMGFALAWGAKYLVTTFGIAQADIGKYLWLPPLLFDLGAVAFGDLASRHRRKTTAPARLWFVVGLLLALSLALLPLCSSPWVAMAVLGAAMAGGGGVYTIANADVLPRMPPQSVSTAAGLMAGAQSLALIVMNPLVGASVDDTGAYVHAAIAVAAWSIPGCLYWLLRKP